MSEQSCISKFIMLILAISLSGCGHSTKPDYLTAENDVPLVGSSINKTHTVQLKYPFLRVREIENKEEFKNFLNEVLKKELGLVFKSVQPNASYWKKYDFYVIPTLTRAKDSDFKLSLAFGVNELGSGRSIVFSTLIDASPSGKEVLGDVAVGSGDALTTTAAQFIVITPFNLLMDTIATPLYPFMSSLHREGYYPGKFTVDRLSNNYPKEISKDIHVREVTSDYRNFSTKISEAVRVLMNQVIAYGDIEGKLKIALIEQKKAAKKAFAEAEKKAAARAKARAIREAKEKAKAKIKIAVAAKQAKANKEKIKSTRLLAERGDVNAQYNLGKIFHEGHLGVSRDDKEALKWYRLAAEQGDSDAQYNLGMIYPKGWSGIQMNKGEAVKWLMKAAVQGDNGARYKLASISPEAAEEVIRIQTMNKAKAQCTELGFTQGTDKHSDCAVRMFSTARADQRMKQQLKENRAENDRLLRQSKTETDRRIQEQARLQREVLAEHARQRGRDAALRMLFQAAQPVQPAISAHPEFRCTSRSFGAGLTKTNCQEGR
jgi:TPR repeat protein